jgi:ribosomal protein S18 acetylase RimI-like enzyme
VNERGELLGYALGRVDICSESELGAVGHVMSIAVEEPFRREGVGSKLMVALHDRFDNMSSRLSTISLFCRVSNEVAIRHYKEKHGYKCAKELKSYYMDGESAWIMERQIKAPQIA